ncbi:acyl-[acyl-carrier-protein] thioesterase [Neolewinella antarctica]|uniref:acyl-[acyl-carrier-protein] thioesterase n=1 Tax=Neolewinella antarctica TaxID=442734 RepID=UPI00143B0F8D|nr:acyl-ACP thioesterase domain-containing protein [Neolewinella antarctica]
MLRQSPLHEYIKTIIPAYATGPTGLLTVPYLVRLFQEAAMLNTLTLKVSSPELMASHGLTWVVRRQRITCHRWPKMSEEVAILTAPTGFYRGLLTYRDFHLLDANDQPIISATSEWLLMDLAARRIRNIPPHVAALEKDLAPATAHLDRAKSKLLPPEEITNEITTEVRYGMLDFNDHLTNPVFPELMLEPLGKAFLDENQPTLIDISFRAEARYGETLRATVGGEGSGRDHGFYRGEELLAVMRTEWKSL